MFIYSLATTHNEVFGMINGTKTGTVRMEVEFSAETLYPLYMIVFSEMSSTLSIDSKREVKLSYVPPLKEL
jgi:nicotinamide riboside transporter PnuC